MEAAAEVAEALRTFYDALNQQDRARMAALLSEDDEFLMIGSNEAWIRDRQAVLDQMSDELAERSPRLVEGAIVAGARGEVGWAADRPTMILPDGHEIPFRYTCVLHREAGTWRVVQSHLSASVTDEDLFAR